MPRQEHGEWAEACAMNDKAQAKLSSVTSIHFDRVILTVEVAVWLSTGPCFDSGMQQQIQFQGRLTSTNLI